MLFTAPYGQRLLPIVSAMALLAGAMPSVALAQAASLNPSAQLAPVVVTGLRQAQRADQALAETTVLDRADIEGAAGRTLIDLLAQAPGIQISNNGGAGRSSSVFMRGLESRHVLLLIDGVRYGSATVGTPSWENLPLEAIDRIEIVRGPLSALYGSDAVGGVVQVFTRAGAAGLAAHGVASVGSNGQGLLGAGLRAGSGAARVAVQAQRSQDEGFSAANPQVPFGNYNPDRDGFDQNSASAQLSWTFLPGWELKVLGLGSQGEAQIDDGAGADARVGLRSQVGAVQLAAELLPQWRSQIKLARAVDGYDTLSSASPFSALGEIATRSTQASWENQIDTPVGDVLLVAERNQQRVSRPGAPFAVSERTLHGLAAGLNGQVDVHHWQVAVRRDRNSQFGSQTTGGAAYGLDINPKLRLTAQIGTSFVAPSFNQLYFPNFGNPKLQPEEGLHKEFGLQWRDSAHQLQIGVYQHRILGYITGGASPVNLPRTQVEGLSFVYAYTGAVWRFSSSIDALDPRNATTASAQFDKLLPRRSREVLRMALERQWGLLTTAAALRHVGLRFDNAANTVPLPAYTLVDLRADWELGSAWKLGVKLNNVGDRSYSTALGYNQPGREWFLTLRYSGQ